MFDPARGEGAAEYLSSFLRMLSCKEAVQEAEFVYILGTSAGVPEITLMFNNLLLVLCLIWSCLERNAVGHVLIAWLRYFDSDEEGDGQVSLEDQRAHKSVVVGNPSPPLCFTCNRSSPHLFEGRISRDFAMLLMSSRLVD